jgi:hypothetical protein
MESTNILQEEEDENISMEEEVCEEEKEKIWFNLRFWGCFGTSQDDSNTQTQNSIVIYENPCTSCEGTRNHDNPSYYDDPLLASNATSKIIDDKECYLDMLYDNALDDGCTLIDNSPYIHEDKNDEFSCCDDALIHESPILLLKSPIYTIEEKYVYIEKYLCGLQLYYKKSYCSHDIKNGTANYFERGKHANECHNKFNDPLYLPKISKFHYSIIHTIKFASSNCNYYERGGDNYPL